MGVITNNSGGKYISMTPGYHVIGGSFQGGNIFRRGLNFLKRNVGRVLKKGVKLIPAAVDKLVEEGAKSGNIPQEHKRLYDQYRKYIQSAPGLFAPLIKRLDENLKKGLLPVDKVDNVLDQIGKKGIKKTEQFVQNLLKPAGEVKGSIQVEPVEPVKGGNFLVKKPKARKKAEPKAKKTTNKKKERL